MASLSAIDFRDGVLYVAGPRRAPSIFFFGVEPPPPPIAPVVGNLTPAVGTPIYPTTALQFDVTDDSGLFTAVIVMASFSDGSYEVVYDSAQFATKYLTSAVASIAGGFRFVVRRTGGWVSAPTIKVVSVDTAGAGNPQ